VRGRRTLFLVLAVLCVLTATGAAAAGTSTDLRGTWKCCGSGGAGAQTWKINSMSAGGSFSGSGAGGSYTFPISGKVVGSSVTLTTGPYAQLPSYSATFKGTISKSGKTMSGTWTSNESQSGTWTATLTSGGHKPKPAHHAKKKKKKKKKKRHAAKQKHKHHGAKKSSDHHR
jgi:hypothetical protein